MVCTLDTGRWAVGANLEPNLRCWFQKVVTLKLNVCRYVDNDWDDAKTSIHCLTQQAARSCGSRESLNVKKHAAAIFCKVLRSPEPTGSGRAGGAHRRARKLNGRILDTVSVLESPLHHENYARNPIGRCAAAGAEPYGTVRARTGQNNSAK